MAALLDIVKKDSTNRSVAIRIIDSTDGTPETGVVWNTSGIDLWYRREGAAKVSITEATLSALTDAHSDGGFLHVGDGEYRLDLPDAAFATGANYVDVGGTVTGMVVIGGRVRLVDVDLEDSVRAGLTALPNAAADAAGGLPISDAGGLDLDTLNSNVSAILTDTAELQGDWTNGGRLDLIIDAILVDTAEIGAAGAGLTAIPWNAAWDAEVQSEVNDGLVAFWTSPATLVDLVWDEVITGAQHNVNNSAAKFLRESAEGIGLTGTAQAGTATTITLAAGESATDNLYQFEQLTIIEGTGAGQARIISAYNGTTKVATVHRAWTTTPDSSSVYSIAGADVDISAISGDFAAADNLESLLDGTGGVTLSGDLSGSVGSVTGAVGSVTGAVGSVTGNVGGNVTGSVGSISGVTFPSNFADLAITASTGRITVGTIVDGAIGADAVADIFSTTAIAEAYATDGSAGTPAQILYLIQQHLGEAAIVSTTKTVKRLDGSTTAATFTLDDANTPTSITRAS